MIRAKGNDRGVSGRETVRKTEGLEKIVHDWCSATPEDIAKVVRDWCSATTPEGIKETVRIGVGLNRDVP